MGRITTGVGLVSGINSKDIIDQLMKLEAAPKDRLQTSIDNDNQQRLAFTDLQTRLASIKLNATTLKKSATFTNATAASSDEGVLTATASPGASIGSFQFQVARLVTTQQSVSSGFENFTSSKIGAGTITIEQGGGELDSQTPLAELNGGDGVRRGQFRIVDSTGKSTVIDTTAAVTLDDVVKKINTSLDISVRATVTNDGLKISDTAGGLASPTIQDLGEGHSAEDLGLLNPTTGSVITGTKINYVGRATLLSQLNDGRGVRSDGSSDFRITLGNGSTVDVSVLASKNVGDVLDAINTAGAGQIRADVDPSGNGIRLTDISGSSGAFTVSAIGNSQAAKDLGILGNAAGSLSGVPIIAGLNTVLLSSLKGGAGVTLGSVTITDRSGVSASVDLSGAHTVQDVLDTLNNISGAGIKASLNASGNGIQIKDTTGGTGNLVIADGDGTNSATALGLAGTFDSTHLIADGGSLQRQYISENTLLSTINGGKGITRGKFKITSASGTSAVIDLSQGNEIRIKDVLAEINTRNIGVTASINANGDGLLLTDTTGGAGTMKVEESGSTTAKDLNILGTATGTTIDGTYEKTLTIDANDTLSTLQTKINNLGFGVTASIINDGSSLAPYRLSLTSKNSGVHGRVVFDAGSTSLKIQTLVEAQDAAVFLGGSDSAQPLLVTAGRNQLAGIIPGVTIDLHGVSSKPVSLAISTNADSAVEQVQQFSDGFNEIVDKIKELTKFDTDTNQGALLLGNSTIQQVQSEIYNALNGVNTTAGRYRVLADVGITLGDGAKIVFDEDKFRAAYGTDPDSVNKLFTSANSGLAAVMESKITRLIDPATGLLTQEEKTIDARTLQFQQRMDALDELLTTKRTRLETQFSNLESVLAGLQSQQQSISQIASISK